MLELSSSSFDRSVLAHGSAPFPPFRISLPLAARAIEDMFRYLIGPRFSALCVWVRVICCDGIYHPPRKTYY